VPPNGEHRPAASDHGGSASVHPPWEALEEFARQGVRQLLQRIPEEEVTPLLGRQRSERRQGVDAPPG
jgi:hypothetical protein